MLYSYLKYYVNLINFICFAVSLKCPDIDLDHQTLSSSTFDTASDTATSTVSEVASVSQLQAIVNTEAAVSAGESQWTWGRSVW